MSTSAITRYTDIEKFEQAVEDIDDSTLAIEYDLAGAPMGRTIEDLIECAKRFEGEIIVSNRTDVPYPRGATFKVEQLHDVADLLSRLGTVCVEDIEKLGGGSISIGYHFD